MDKINFIAVDVETAVSKSVCQIGIVVVEKGVIVKEICQLIKPPSNQYNKYNIDVHGITPDKTENAPSFSEAWEELKEYFRYSVVVAHNATFDMSVLEYECKRNNLEFPKVMDVICTYRLTDLKLKDACKCYGVCMEQHHNAVSDARCCAELFIKYLTSDMGKPIVISDDCVEKEEKKESHNISLEYHTPISGDLLVQKLDGADPNNPFYDKKVVITGVFPIDRIEIAKKIQSMGADINSTISRKTDIVLAGSGAGPKKLEKIADL